MKPRDDFHNGGDEDGGSESGSEGEGEPELWVEDPAAPARALAALNALRKSRQHYDVVLVAGDAGGEGGEVPAHRALLAAASPYLLQQLAAPAAAAYRVEGVAGEALRALVEYVYTGRLRAADAAGARRLYAGAWRLRLESARAALAERLVRRLAPADCLDTRALPDLPPDALAILDAYIADHFDELCSNGALSALPLVRIELLRAADDAAADAAPLAVAEAALAWLRDHSAPDTLEELCSRPHLVYLDASGELCDCGQLPAARGDAPELQEYRAAALRRRELQANTAEVRNSSGARPPRALPGVELGARAAGAACAVLAARGGAAGAAGGGGGCVRALLALRGRLLAARLARRAGARGRQGGGGGARRAGLAIGRCAHGSAVLGNRLVVCGGYDRLRVLRAAAAYCPAANEWAPLPDMRTARARFPAARLGNKLYVFGGSDGHNELDSVDVYDDETKTWSSVTKLPTAASHLAAAGHEESGALYVVGGWAGGRSLRAVSRYHPASGAWSEAPPLQAGRSQCALVLWEGALWALGGCDTWHCLASCERLQLAEPRPQWRPAAPLPTARRSVGGTVWRSMLVSAGGSDGAASLRRVEFLGAAGAAVGAAGEGAAWRAGPQLRRPRAALGLHALDDVLFAVGGYDGKEFLSCMECLYTADGEWTTLTAPPPVAAPGEAGADSNGAAADPSAPSTPTDSACSMKTASEPAKEDQPVKQEVLENGSAAHE